MNTPLSDQPEPLAAILAEMRREAGAQTNPSPLYRYADRIEAAAERERVKVRRDAEIEWTRIGYEERKAEERPGNAAAMRAALDDAHRLIEAFLATVGDRGMRSQFVEMRHRIDAALAAPARNCDVGTAEEQAERHERFCAAHYKADAVDAQCFGCPASDKKETDCEFVWGQLPFAPAQGGAK